ncbi:MAG: CHAT domain-containing protein [Pseudomonadota bacterium]
MTAFYDRLAHGLTPAPALRQAKLELLLGASASTDGVKRGLQLGTTAQPGAAASATSHPYFWSAFIMMGDSEGCNGSASQVH